MPRKKTIKNKEGVLESVEDVRRALLNILEDGEEEKRRAEEEKNKTLAIIANFVDGLLAFDQEGKLSLVNPRAEAFFDVKGKDIIGRTLKELEMFPIFAPFVDLVSKNDTGISRKEMKVREKLTLEVSTVNIPGDDGRSGFLVILHDISREKAAEAMKTEFVSLAAHQLRTPLSAIKWTLKIILDGDVGQVGLEQKALLEKTYKSNERMIALVNDLLDVARIEEGKYLFKPILTSLETVVEFVANAYKDEAKRKSIQLNFVKQKDDLPKVMADVEKIRLVIQNLIDNALRYTKERGRVVVSVTADENNVEVTVKDNGVGIPTGQKERIFTKFFRASNVLRIDTEGSGLGLFISKNIVDAHGGKIWLESAENEGTAFHFSLPVKEEFAEFLEK